MKRLAALILCVFPAYAQPPFLPIAVCDKGICTMKQKDFEDYQRFHIAVYQVMGDIQEQARSVQNENNQMRGLIEKNLHCQLGRKI